MNSPLASLHLVVDIGNTNQKLAVFSQGEMIHLEQHEKITVLMLRAIFHSFPGIVQAGLLSVVRCSLSVVRHIESHCPLMMLDSRTPVPLRNRYQTPETLGVDRLASAVAAQHLFPRCPVLVITLGTCITYDFVNSRKEYLGGAISPGMMMRFRALHTFTGRLPLIEEPESVPPTGLTTAASIQRGVILGMIHEINGMAAAYQQKYKGLKILLSGGDAPYFEKRLNFSTFARPNLVLSGLNQIIQFNEIRK